jgi:hypothetical protein
VKKGGSEKIPEFLDIPRSQIQEWWDLWPLWRQVEGNVPAFVAAMPLPKGMLDTMFFLDNFLAKMEAEHAKELKKKSGSKT